MYPFSFFIFSIRVFIDRLQQIYINYTFYVSGLLNDLVGGEIKTDDGIFSFYVEDEIIYYETTLNDTLTKVRGEMKEDYYKIAYVSEEGKEEVVLKFNFSNTEYAFDMNVDTMFSIFELKFDVESSVHKNSENDFTIKIKLDMDGEYVEVTLDNVTNYDFEFNTLPSKTEVDFISLSDESFIELMKSVVYSFENTPVGDELITEFEALLIDPYEDLVTKSISVADSVASQVLIDEMRGNEYTCYSIDYLINNNIVTGLEPAFGTYSGYDGVVTVNRLTDTITLYQVTLVDYTNSLYISQYKSGLTTNNVLDYNYFITVPTCAGYNSPS